MKEAVSGVLAVTLIAGLSLAVAGPLTSGAGTVYTVPQVLASLPSLRGRTISVRGILGYPEPYWGWVPAGRLCRYHCTPVYAVKWKLVHGDTYSYRDLVVTAGPQDPFRAALRSVHALPPFPAFTDVPQVYRVQILAHPPACAWPVSCPRAVLLDTLR
jgi:hypothetical protein